MRRVGWLPVLLLGAVGLQAQEGGAPGAAAGKSNAPGSADVAPAAKRVVTAPKGETAVDGLTRRDANSVVLTLPDGRELVLHDFEWNGQAVRTSSLHLKQTAPGVVEITSLAYAVGDWRFRVRDAANYYGLGERAGALNHARSIVKMAMAAGGDAGAMGAGSTKPMPFYMSTSGYGLWVDAASETTFDMNVSSAEDVVVTVPADRLRVVLFPGPEFAGILEKFTRAMGTVVLPPYWAFAPWKVRGDGETEAQVVDDVEKLRELKLPASVVLVDDPWESGTYAFDAKRFDDAAAMMKRAHEAGMKVVVGVSPWIARPNPDPAGGWDDDPFVVKTADATAYVRVGVRRSSAVDLTSGAARSWWQDALRGAMKAGVDGFAVEDATGGFPAGAKFGDASDARMMQNRYAMLAAQTAQELVDKDLKSDGVVVSEDATEGVGGAGFVLASGRRASFDAETGLPTLLNAALSAGLSGEPLWAGTMGAGKGDDAVLARWAEFACFSPVMVTTAGPWEFGDAAFEVYRKYAALNMSLFPYRYAAAMEAAKTGMPVMRALVLAYQGDERARTAKDEYLFGPDLLVAPVMDESTARLVYLPKGYWVNYWTGAQAEGGKSMMVDVPLDTVPVYARMGAVIPMVVDAQTLVAMGEGGNAAAGSLDGRRVYELVGPGESSITDFEGRAVARTGTQLTVSGGPAARVIVRWKFVPVHGVTVNGAAVNLQTGKDGAFVEFDYAEKALVEWQ